MDHTSGNDLAPVVDTRLKDRRRVDHVKVAVANEDRSLASRELSFLVRLAQAAASTQRPDELLDLIIRETTSALGTDVCSLYLLTARGRELRLTATNGLTEPMIRKVTLPAADSLTAFPASS